MDRDSYVIRSKELISLFRDGKRSAAIDKLIDLKNEYPELKNEMVLVSILTPSYNSAKYIEETIQSVIDQTYIFVEHVVQDGDSSDGTKDILEKYTKYLNWVSEPDNGEADGLNKAIKRANGDILLVLNADDILLPDSCSRAVWQFNMNPGMAVIYGNQHMINSNGEILYDRIASPYDFIKELCVENVIPAQTAFIQRKCFEEAGLYADASLPVVPDYEMWIRIGLRFPMLYVPDFVCKYRVHDGQQTAQINKIAETRLLVMERIFQNPELGYLHEYRDRAYAGNLHWAAVEYFKCRNKKEALSRLLKAYELNPDIRKAHPLISIITVIENSGKYLEKNILSALNQSYLYVEHIVIDNRSAGGTLEILQKYDSQVEWESGKRVNTPEAVNNALKKCHGDIIHILDPADEMCDNTCWWGMYHFGRFPDNIILFGDYSIVDSNCLIRDQKSRNKPFSYKRMFCLEDQIRTSTCFISRRYFEKIGLCFETKYPGSYFYEFLIKAGKKYSVSYHNGAVSRLRTLKSEKKDYLTILKAYEERKQIIFENYKSNKNPHLLKKRADAGLNYWLSREMLRNEIYKSGIRQLLISITNPFTFIHILEIGFMPLVKIFIFIRHLNYLIVLKPTYRFRNKIGLTSERVKSRFFNNNTR